MDFHSSFRLLALFNPARASGAEVQTYIAEFADRLVRTCQVARRDEEREPAVKAFEAWLGVYAARATGEADSGNAEVDVEAWATKRREGMQAANPRFVLRQWVLEEVIRDMEAGLAEGDEAGRMEARAKLNRVLEVGRVVFVVGGLELMSRCRPTRSRRMARRTGRAVR
jgi:uncharacterized protein YdiU (UPF0061 family)